MGFLRAATRGTRAKLIYFCRRTRISPRNDPMRRLGRFHGPHDTVFQNPLE